MSKKGKAGVEPPEKFILKSGKPRPLYSPVQDLVFSRDYSLKGVVYKADISGWFVNGTPTELDEAKSNARKTLAEWCQEERDAGNGGCGACALCCKEANARAEMAEAKCAALLDERDRLREALPDPKKLRALAAWIDLKYPNDAEPEVQSDLRRWATLVEQALAPKEKPHSGKE